MVAVMRSTLSSWKQHRFFETGEAILKGAMMGLLAAVLVHFASQQGIGIGLGMVRAAQVDHVARAAGARPVTPVADSAGAVPSVDMKHLRLTKEGPSPS